MHKIKIWWFLLLSIIFQSITATTKFKTPPKLYDMHSIIFRFVNLTYHFLAINDTRAFTQVAWNSLVEWWALFATAFRLLQNGTEPRFGTIVTLP